MMSIEPSSSSTGEEPIIDLYEKERQVLLQRAHAALPEKLNEEVFTQAEELIRGESTTSKKELMKTLKGNLIKGQSSPKEWMQNLVYRPDKEDLFYQPKQGGRPWIEVNKKLGIVEVQTYELRTMKHAVNTYPSETEIYPSTDDFMATVRFASASERSIFWMQRHTYQS